jgi:hypothetical protein
VPKVRVEEAWPLPLVVVVVADSEPEPVATAQSICWPETTFPFESLATATKALESAPPATPLWLLPETTEMTVAAPGFPVAVKVTFVPVPWIVAVTEFAPARVPKVRMEEARPLASVVEEATESEPPPEAIDQSI